MWRCLVLAACGCCVMLMVMLKPVKKRNHVSVQGVIVVEPPMIIENGLTSGHRHQEGVAKTLNQG